MSIISPFYWIFYVVLEKIATYQSIWLCSCDICLKTCFPWQCPRMLKCYQNWLQDSQLSLQEVRVYQNEHITIDVINILKLWSIGFGTVNSIYIWNNLMFCLLILLLYSAVHFEFWVFLWLLIISFTIFSQWMPILQSLNWATGWSHWRTSSLICQASPN